MDEPKDPWGLAAKIAAGVGGAALVIRELIRAKWSPAQSREHTEQHYSEIFLEEIKNLRADTKAIRDHYEERIVGYRKQIHEANQSLMKVLGVLYQLGYELNEDGEIVQMRIEKGPPK